MRNVWLRYCKETKDGGAEVRKQAILHSRPLGSWPGHSCAWAKAPSRAARVRQLCGPVGKEKRRHESPEFKSFQLGRAEDLA